MKLELPEGYSVTIANVSDFLSVQVFRPARGYIYTSPEGEVRPFRFPDGTIAAPIVLAAKVVIDLGAYRSSVPLYPVEVEVITDNEVDPEDNLVVLNLVRTRLLQ